MKHVRRYFLAFMWVCLLVSQPVFPTAAQEQAPDSSGTVIHTVAWGETLARIAARYGSSVEEIVAANNLAGADFIYAGQRLVIPAGSSRVAAGTPGATHVVQPGETVYRIGLAYGVSSDALIRANNLPASGEVYAGEVLSIPAAGAQAAPPAAQQAGTYQVQSGDTLYAIGVQWGVSVSDLMAANNLIATSIYTGQILRLPGAANANGTGYTPSDATTAHVVMRGETLTSIAARYGISPWVLAQTNNIANPSLLYVGQVLSIPQADALTSSPPAPAVTNKRIVVDVSDQRTYVYENDQLLWEFVSSTGEPGRETWRGEFAIQNKIPVAYASTWGITMPKWLGFYWAGSLQNGFHALPIQADGSRLWAGWLGTPVSYGCVILSDHDAELLYNWAEVGTPVRVQD